MNNLFSLPKKLVCGYMETNDKEAWSKKFDDTIDEFMKRSRTKKDRSKVNFGDMARGICWEDVEDFNSLKRYMQMDVEMQIITSVNISLACGSSADNISQIYEDKKWLHTVCVYTKKVSTDLYFNIMRTIPQGYGGLASVMEDLNKENILHLDGIKVKLEIQHD